MIIKKERRKMTQQDEIREELKEICIRAEQVVSECAGLESDWLRAQSLEQGKTMERADSSSKIFFLQLRFESIEAVLADLDKKISTQENIVGHSVLMRDQAKMTSEMQSCRAEMERMEAIERGQADELDGLRREKCRTEDALAKLAAEKSGLAGKALSLLAQLHRLNALP